MESSGKSKSSVLAFLERNGCRDRSNGIVFHLSGELHSSLLLCLQRKFEDTLSTEDRSAVATTCYQLHDCIANMMNAETGGAKIKEAQVSPSLLLCSAVIALTDFGIRPRESITALSDCFKSSVFDLFNLVKYLSRQQFFINFHACTEEVAVIIIQSLLWKSNSVLWNQGTNSRFTAPTYEDINQQRKLEKTGQSCQKPSICNSTPLEQSEVDISESIKSACSKTSSTLSVFHEVYNYAFKRFETLCEILSVDYLRDMWTVFNHIVSGHSQEIIRDRHLDQVIICTVYALCKAKIPVCPPSFKTVIRCYTDLPNSDPNILENFRASAGDAMSSNKPSHFIRFYNGTFLPPIKSFIRSHAIVDSSSLQHSPTPSYRDSAVRVSDNVYVSPLRKGLPSPQRAMEYKFSSSPSHHLQNINDMLKKSPGAKRDAPASTKPKPTKMKRISFQDDRTSDQKGPALPR